MEHFLEKITPLRHWHVFQWNSLRTSVASSPVWSSGFWRDRVGSQFGFGIRTWVGKGSKFSFYRFGLVSSRTGSKFRLFGGVRMVSNFDFGGSTGVQVSSKFNLSSSKQFEIRYSIWIQPILNMYSSDLPKHYQNSNF